jgi:hypothetical protein
MQNVWRNSWREREDTVALCAKGEAKGQVVKPPRKALLRVPDIEARIALVEHDMAVSAGMVGALSTDVRCATLTKWCRDRLLSLVTMRCATIASSSA